MRQRAGSSRLRNLFAQLRRSSRCASPTCRIRTRSSSAAAAAGSMRSSMSRWLRLRPGGRLVVNCVTMQTLTTTWRCLRAARLSARRDVGADRAITAARRARLPRAGAADLHRAGGEVMTMALIAVTAGGIEQARRLRARLGSGDLLRPEKFGPAAAAMGSAVRRGACRSTSPTGSARYDQLVFFLATGATVRLIAPCLASKTSDPAVLAVDEAGRFVIPLRRRPCSRGQRAGPDRRRLSRGDAGHHHRVPT